MALSIVGLGPGDASLITRQVWHLLSSASELYLRTSRHPAAAQLPPHLQLHSFDDIYETADAFADVYETIARTLVELAATKDVIYAVPGNPYVGEATVTAVNQAAREASIAVTTLPGLSFVEPVLAALEIDLLDGVQIVDALALSGFLFAPLNPDVPVVVGQVYSRHAASELKLVLLTVYGEEHDVALIHAAGTPEQLVEHLPLYEIDRSDHISHLTSLYIPPLPVKADLSALAETVAVLRSPEGCPWDIEQTPQSMREGFLEEAYEVLAALDTGDEDNLREELGDLLYHIVMQAQMASEAESFKLSDVVAGIEAKLKRRHPHVWGDWTVSDTAQVLLNWDKLKEQEKSHLGQTPESILDGILEQLPSLARSQKIQGRVARQGFDWPDIEGVYDKLAEEVAELRAAQKPEERQMELGDILFVVANLARWLDVEAESALREANNRFTLRYQQVERLAAERGLDMTQMDINALETLWQEAKRLVAQND